jgi:hypothetical protein
VKKTILSLLTIATMACTSTAFAVGDEGWYVVGGMGQATSTNDQSQTDASLISVGYTGFRSTVSDPRTAVCSAYHFNG